MTDQNEGCAQKNSGKPRRNRTRAYGVNFGNDRNSNNNAVSGNNTRATSPLTQAPAPALAALAPALAIALALSRATEAQDKATVCKKLPKLHLQPRQPKPTLRQDAQIPRSPASPEDGQNIQTLAAPVPEPLNAVKGSLPETRMAKPRFKAVHATTKANPAPAATAANAPTITPDTPPQKPRLARHRQQIQCSVTS